jgi:hypothetical protein
MATSRRQAKTAGCQGKNKVSAGPNRLFPVADLLARLIINLKTWLKIILIHHGLVRTDRKAVKTGNTAVSIHGFCFYINASGLAKRLTPAAGPAGFLINTDFNQGKILRSAPAGFPPDIAYCNKGGRAGHSSIPPYPV